VIGIFGGSFDPPHFGHIKSALGLLERYSFEQIRFIPAHLSPLKESMQADAYHRWQMVNLICNSHEKFIADDRELNRPQKPSYTIDTLQELRKEQGEHQSLVLIMGVDAFLNLSKWHQYEDILSLCHILLLQRPGYSISDTQGEFDYYNINKTENIEEIIQSPQGKIYLSNMEKIEVSSTAIRNIIAAGQQPKYLLPGNVWNYIRRNKLYK